jgi:membrane protein YqaA with SNARE-associated domain
MQVIGNTAGRNLGYQLGRAFENAIRSNAGLAARRETKEHVRLRFVV